MQGLLNAHCLWKNTLYLNIIGYRPYRAGGNRPSGCEITTPGDDASSYSFDTGIYLPLFFIDICY